MLGTWYASDSATLYRISAIFTELCRSLRA